MLLDIHADNRVGITGEILTVIAGAGHDVRRLEVVTHHVYAELPGLRPPGLDGLRAALLAVPGLWAVTPVEALPGDRRQQALELLADSYPDALVVAEPGGGLAAANRAAQAILDGAAVLPDPVRAMLDRGQPQAQPVTLNGQAWMVEVIPSPAVAGPDGGTGGGIVVFRHPQRLGQALARVGPGEQGSLDAILGTCPAILAVKDRVRRFADVDAPVLIGGETGVGKELVARAIHGAGRRHDAPFLALNCAALPETLVESELFGYAPGAFSGAARDGKLGLLELADGGTVFLDEIGEMSPYVQSKLLRFLADGTFRRVGGKQERRVSVRIVSATHRDLAAACADKTFREDLLYRLSVLQVDVPPLRRRGEDIPVLIDSFLDSTAARLGRPVPRLTDAARQALCRYDWPGNVRQLQNVLFRALTLTDAPLLEAAAFDLGDAPVLPPPPLPPLAGEGPAPETPREDPAADPADWDSAQAAFERDLLARLWPRYPSTRRLAERLKVSHTTIAQKLRAYGLR
ncbi:sigma 54-interacting transcriptional regulator [Novispirillum itersonii]|uniref:HTH-type transcriptional regulatory protein TyrR n=1 Tax=Novispirillum itersonii TaxID=189 RepID=A0A7X0DNC1_NOVIT|nr:sigma 54-interacting transcriptional regulator [Novispirillum itersonii]MBB6211204.1 TyrR family helix-turn-helix protein [Novispirillum itersonii]